MPTTAFVWDMNPDRWKQQACTVVGHTLSREEWNEFLADRRYPARLPIAKAVSTSPRNGAACCHHRDRLKPPESVSA
jgi:hypothetical protein